METESNNTFISAIALIVNLPSTCYNTSHKPAQQWHGREILDKTLKRDYIKLANWPDSKTVMAQLKSWLDDYNLFYPYSALGLLPPMLLRDKRSVA